MPNVDQPPRKRREPKKRYRAVCTVPGCDWKGEPAKAEARAVRGVAKHAIEQHAKVQPVQVRRVVVDEVIEPNE